MNVSADMVSEFSKDIYKLYHGGKDVTDEKAPHLFSNVRDKARYGVHIRNLKCYLQKGLRLINVHICLKFGHE